MLASILKGLSSFFSAGQGWELFGGLLGVLGVLFILVVAISMLFSLIEYVAGKLP